MIRLDVAEAPNLLYIPVPAADCVELAVDYRFDVAGLTIWIPMGFRWNGASIPRYLWGIVGGRYEPDRLLATLEHDWIYLFHCVERQHADTLFHRRLKEANVEAWKRLAMYQAVRAVGWRHWHTSNEARKDIERTRAILEARVDGDKFARLMLAS